ncbi:MAG TPA: molybdopterin dinucleotide binding domain-containing protein, partial [Roseiflexaceae bacterium]|nr:molybdopterin dinucleotide binding domain-containing protein [Roseiflexaceae bacterium]
PDERAHFVPVPLPDNAAPPGMLRVATRRGKQFNSIVHEHRDALNGAEREAILISAEDAARLGMRNGDPLRLYNDQGELHGRVLIAALRPGNLQVHWPEGNVLLAGKRRSPQAGIPDYNAFVFVEPMGTQHEQP